MALTGLPYIIATGLDFVPHIEHAAMKYVFAKYAMASRVKVMTDMAGWNTRKVSEYLPPSRATELSEDTAIPDHTILRARKVELSPKEVGERYRISDRRVDSDPEGIVTEAVEYLGQAIGSKVEADLFAQALSTFQGGTIGDGTADLSLAQMLQAKVYMNQLRRSGTLFVVAHQYQTLPIIQSLIDFSGATVLANSVGAVPVNARDQALMSFDLPAFGNLNVVAADMLPRNVVYKIGIDGTGGTFRLQVGDGYAVGVNVTAAITVTGTHATDLAAILAALNALTGVSGTWTGASTSMTDITITPPSTLYLDDDCLLRPAVKYDADATLSTQQIYLQKSAYDLVTGGASMWQDMNGNDLGFRVQEKSATAKALVFYRDALAFDIRKRIKAHFETVYQGRTGEWAAYMTYGAGQWSPEKGMFLHTVADSPLATG